eukprot:EG_transcript_26248
MRGDAWPGPVALKAAFIFSLIALAVALSYSSINSVALHAPLHSLRSFVGRFSVSRHTAYNSPQMPLTSSPRGYTLSAQPSNQVAEPTPTPSAFEDLSFRPYAITDWPEVARVCATVYCGGDYLPTLLEDRYRSGAPSSFYCFVLEDPAHLGLRGIGAFEMLAEGQALLLGIRVDPLWQGRGLAHAITRHTTALAAERCQRSGAPWPRLLTVTVPENVAMRRVLAQAGYRAAATVPMWPPEEWMEE